MNIVNAQTLPARSMTTYVESLSSSLNRLNPGIFKLFDARYNGDVLS